jgi:ABC-type transport system involved in multi-copper enzyme maturation permease subunit
MTALPLVIRVVRWMIWDTYRQSLASRLLWVMLGLTFLCTLLCLSISVTGDDTRPLHPHELPLYVPADEDSEQVRAEGIRVVSGEVSLGFGLVRFPVGRSRQDAVHWFQVWLAGVLADTVGVLLALLWTAAYLPQFLEPQSISVLLAKPTPRWALLVGKYLGVVLFVGLNAFLFILTTWFSIGLSTGIWEIRYWLALPLLVMNFSIFYAFSVLLAVCSRGVIVPLFGTLIFWILCWAMNITRHTLLSVEISELASMTPLLVEVGYWVLPKPLDWSGLFYELMRAESVAAPVPEWETARQKGGVIAELSVLSSLFFGLVMLVLAAWEFRRAEY